jgi:hypothetical protein
MALQAVEEPVHHHFGDAAQQPLAHAGNGARHLHGAINGDRRGAVRLGQRDVGAPVDDARFALAMHHQSI